MTVPEQAWADLGPLPALEEFAQRNAERSLHALTSDDLERSERLKRELRDEEALRLHEVGLSYRQIAAQMGYSSSSRVHDAIHRARNREPQDTLYERKLDQQAQLDLCERRLFEILEREPPPGADSATIGMVHDAWIKAGVALVRVLERSARLWGLDAPRKAVVKVPYITPEALAAYRKQLDAELLEMGIDVSSLPTVEDRLDLMRAR